MEDQDKGTGEMKRRRKSASESVENVQILGAGIAQWLERRTRDRMAVGSSPDRSGGRIFFSMVIFLC